MSTPTSGHTVARWTLAVGAGTSVLGNIWHSVENQMPIGATVFSVFWPAALFLGVELMIRGDWLPRWLDWLIRVVGVSGVATMAAIVSFRHLSALLAGWGEDAVTANLGPLAIDGLMLMATYLLAVRRSAPVVEEIAPVSAPPEETAPVSAPPAPPEETAPPAPKAPRSSRSPVDPEKVALLLLQGMRVADVATTVGAGESTVGRYATVLRTIRADRNAIVDAKVAKVHPDAITLFRREVRQP